MDERAKAFREIAEAIMGPVGDRPYGSCCGCSNIGDDAIIFLRDRFPDDLPYIYDSGEKYDKKAWIDDAREGDHD